MRHPACTTPDECRILDHGTFTTAAAWSPEYDGDGNIRNAGTNPNTRTTRLSCRACGRRWDRIHRRGETTYADF